MGYTDGLQRRHSMFVRLVEERNALGLAIFGYGIAKLLELLGRWVQPNVDGKISNSSHNGRRDVKDGQEIAGALVILTFGEDVRCSARGPPGVGRLWVATAGPITVTSPLGRHRFP